jgi:hypothetical protein
MKNMSKNVKSHLREDLREAKESIHEEKEEIRKTKHGMTRDKEMIKNLNGKKK